MTRFLMMLVAFTVQNVWADMTIQVVDKQNNPVPNAVISVPGLKVNTPADLAIMDQVYGQFSPRVLVVQKGQSVSFPNSDEIRHHVYSFSKPKAFEIKLYKGNATAPLLFDKAGLVVLGCNIHDDMIGYIYVADNHFAVKTDEQGRATLPAKAGDEITIWDENLASTLHAKKTLIAEGEQEQIVVLDLLPSVAINTHDHASGRANTL
ncbi:methylamine utilization protein [Marinomonas sp. NPDC078689]|uniref:methylamine utilization protein n=1 Tax=Marinomonas sp. NPDC078689 TaxID=3364147 RepID=UPI0037C6B17E